MLTEYLAEHLGQMRDMRYGDDGYVTHGVQDTHPRPDRFQRLLPPHHARRRRKEQHLRIVRIDAGEIKSQRGGALVASEGGPAVTYGLINAQRRGDTFIDPGTPVYEGMVVGSRRQEGDIEINVCKEKKLTNMRSSTADVAERLNATIRMSLEETLEFISDDELVEVTPQNLRIRKMELSALDRKRRRRDGTRVRV